MGGFLAVVIRLRELLVFQLLQAFQVAVSCPSCPCSPQLHTHAHVHVHTHTHAHTRIRTAYAPTGHFTVLISSFCARFRAVRCWLFVCVWFVFCGVLVSCVSCLVLFFFRVYVRCFLSVLHMSVLHLPSFSVFSLSLICSFPSSVFSRPLLGASSCHCIFASHFPAICCAGSCVVVAEDLTQIWAEARRISMLMCMVDV